jgi:hypothetical protein
MSHAQCPRCGYRVGLGICSEIGACPRCELPLMLTGELRALTPEQSAEEAAAATETAQLAAREQEPVSDPTTG